jgi:hypothetical protein
MANSRLYFSRFFPAEFSRLPDFIVTVRRRIFDTVLEKPVAAAFIQLRQLGSRQLMSKGWEQSLENVSPEWNS